MRSGPTPASPSVHPAAAEGFAAGAETYVRGRPDYPPEALDWLRHTLGLGDGKVALDLGAGTGKFTKVLLATGARVIAVDPVAQMLEQLRRNAPAAEPVAGDASNIPVLDGAVDAVVCSQSFHWFATAAALREIHRVLRPGGVLGLIWNVRDQSVDWVAQLSAMIAPYEGDAPRMTSGEWRKLFPAPGFGPLHESRFSHGHTGSPEQVVVDRVKSISFIAALPAADRERVAAAVRDLIRTTPSLAGRSEVTFPYFTSAWYCTRL
jgi:SAM-dependent methyltransferase